MSPGAGLVPEKDEAKQKLKQAAELAKQGQAMLKKAETTADFEKCAQVFTDAISIRPDRPRPNYYFSRGRCFASMGHFQRALFDFSMAIRLDPAGPGVAKHYGNRGFCFRKLGRIEEALEDYNDALAYEKENAQHYYERALVFDDLEDYEAAIADFSQALEKRFANQFRAHFHRGICYRKTGKLEQSVADLKAAIGADATSPEAQNHLGLSYTLMKHFKDAKDCFTAAMELQECMSGNPKYINNRGLASYHMQEYDEAIADFTLAIKYDSATASIFFNRGNAHFAKGEHPLALQDYDVAITLDAQNPLYLHHKGLAYQGSHMVREALTYYQRALQCDPNHSPSRFHLGIMYHMDGQYEAALEAFELVPKDHALYERRGLVYRDQGEYERALVDFEKAIELQPENPAFYYHRGVVSLRMHRDELAIQDFNKALDLGSSMPCIYNDRGLAWRELGNMAQAVQDLTSAMELEAKTEFMSNRAQCFFEQGLYDRAEIDLSEALKLDPQDPQLLYKRGLTRYAQKRYAAPPGAGGAHRGGAIDDLKAAILHDPYPANLADIYYHLGVSYANLGKHSEAVPALDQAVLRCPHFPHYVHERAKSLQVIGEHEKALQDFTRVLEMQPTNARALFRRAFSFKSLKLYDEAAEDFEAAKEFEPEDPRLVINYRKIYSIACISLGPAGHEDTSTYKAD